MKQTIKSVVRKIPFSYPLYSFLNKTFYLWPQFLAEYLEFEKRAKRGRPRFSNKVKDWSPKLYDKAPTTYFNVHYTYHPAWAARILTELRPELHIDVSSIQYFSAMISAIVPVKFYDYRPVDLHLPNLTSDHADLLKLPFADESIKSLSCMHVVEHVGLGRYGETIDPDGDLKAMAELKRVLAPGGCLLFVTPVGKPKIDFNQHRIYSYEHIMEGFSGLTLKEFSLIPDDVSNGMIMNADPALVGEQSWGCGCFWFTK